MYKPLHDKTKQINEYDQEVPQSHTTDQPLAPWGTATEQSQDIKKTIKVKLPAISSP